MGGGMGGGQNEGNDSRGGEGEEEEIRGGGEGWNVGWKRGGGGCVGNPPLWDHW